MNRFSSIATTGVLAMGAVLSLAPATAHATAVTRYELQNATGVCQAALPNFDGQIRKRPTAISNEGNAVTFVSCSIIGDAARASDNVGVYLTNNSAVAQTVNCTLINGSILGRTFFVKSLELAAGMAGKVTWTAVENAGAKFDVPNIQCAYQPGVEMNFVEREFKEGVAN